MNRRKNPKICAIKLSLLPSLSALGAIGCQENAKMKTLSKDIHNCQARTFSLSAGGREREKWNLMSFPGRFGLKSQFSTSGPPNNYALPKVKLMQESQFSGKLATICKREEPGIPNSKINIVSFVVFHLLLTELKFTLPCCVFYIVYRIFQKWYILKHINKI